MLFRCVVDTCKGNVAAKAARDVFFAGVEASGDFPHPAAREAALQDSYLTLLESKGQDPMKWRVVMDDLVSRLTKVSDELYYEYLCREYRACTMNVDCCLEIGALRNHFQRATQMYPSDKEMLSLYAEFERTVGNVKRANSISKRSSLVPLLAQQPAR